MSAVAPRIARAPPNGSSTLPGISQSSSKNQRLADALAADNTYSADQSAFSFPMRTNGNDRSFHDSALHSSKLRHSTSSDADEQFQDVEDDHYTDPNQPSPAVMTDGRAQRQWHPRSTRTSVDTHWDESEFQRQAADRMSKYSAVTRYDGADDDDAHNAFDVDEDGMEAYPLSGDPDSRSTYGHTRTSSVGSSIWAGKGATASNVASSSTTPSRKRKTQGTKPPPLPSSSAALQQLRDKGEFDGLDSPQTGLPQSPLPKDSRQQLQVVPDASGLSSAYNSPNLSEAKASAASNFLADGDFELVNAPTSPGSGPSTSRTTEDGTPYPPLPPMPPQKAASDQNRRKRDGSKGSGRRDRSPILSYDGGVESEERILNSSDQVDDSQGGLRPPDSEVEQTEESATLKRSLSHMGPKLRKNEPAPWEMDAADDDSVRTSLQSNSTPYPASPNAQSPWSRFTRGSLDVREKEGGDARRNLGLGVNLKRPSGEMVRRPSGEATRDASRSTGTSPKSKGRFKPFIPGGGNSSNSQLPPPPLPPSVHEASSSSGPLRSSPSVGTLHPERPPSVDAASGSNVSLVADGGRDGPSTASRPFSPESLAPSNASNKFLRPRTKSVTHSAANVLKGLGLGGDKKHREEGKEGASGNALSSNKLAKALKKKGERDELSLAKGISSADFKPSDSTETTEFAATHAQRPSTVSSQEARSPPSAFNAASVRAAVNKDLVNPFASKPGASATHAESSNERGQLPRDASIDGARSDGGTSVAAPSLAGTTSDTQVVTNSGLASQSLQEHDAPGGMAGPTTPLRASSPRAPQRELSLAAGSMSSLNSLSGTRSAQGPSPSSSLSSRGMGVGYRKTSGKGEPYMSSGGPTPFRRPERQASGSAGPNAPRPGSPGARHASDGLETSAAAQDGLGQHAATAQKNIERRQAPGPYLAPGQDQSAPATAANTSLAPSLMGSESPGSMTPSPSGLPTSPSGLPTSPSGLPTPGSHEGVPYKLISLEQAQAQQQAKTREAAQQRAANAAGTDAPSVHREPSASSHRSSEHTMSVSHDETSDKDGTSGKTLKNKKSGLLKMFGRGNDKHQDDQHVPTLPSGLPSSTTLKSLDMSSNLHPSYSVKSSLVPGPGLPTAASTQTLLAGGESNDTLGLSPPALDALRPVSSMFASLSPGLLDDKKGDGEKVSKSPSEALAALQGQSAAQSKEELQPRSAEDEQRLRVKSSDLAAARGHSPSSIKVAEWAASHPAAGPPLRSPSVASTGIHGSEFHSPATSPMERAFPEASVRGSSEDLNRNMAALPNGSMVTRPLQLVDRSESARKVSGDRPPGSLAAVRPSDEGRRSSTFSRESEASSQQISGMPGPMPPVAQSGSGSLLQEERALPEAVRNRIVDIEAKMSELLSELTHLRATHAPGVNVASVDSSHGLSNDGSSHDDLGASKTFGHSHPPSSPIPPSSSPLLGPSRACTPVPPCSSCGCKCAEMKRLQAVNEMHVLKHVGSSLSVGGTASSASSVLDRGRGVKKRPEEAGRFGAYHGR